MAAAAASPLALATARLRALEGTDAVADEGLLPTPVDALEILAAPAQPATPQRLRLVAEVALRLHAGSVPGVPLRELLLALASRCGWRLAEAVDLSAAGLRLREELPAAFERQRAALAHDGIDVDAAMAELGLRLAALRRGEHRVEALHFERRQTPPLHPVAVDAGRSAAMRALFAEVFGHEMSADHWHWKYGRGPGRAVALDDGSGRLVAHYGGLTRELRVFGRAATACQVCDVMVLPQANRSLARRAPLQQVAATFLEREIGWGRPHAYGYGFPNERHQALAERLGLYVAVDRLVQLVWPSGGGPRHWVFEPVTRVEGAIVAHQRRVVDVLWGEMAAAMHDVALGVRDAQWLQWRYLERPGVDYAVHLVRSRWLRRVLGLIVVRPRGDAFELLDLVAPPARFSELVDAARALAAAGTQPLLRAWVTQSQQHRLAAAGGVAPRVEPLPIVVPGHAHSPGTDALALQNRWFLLGGDADFT